MSTFTFSLDGGAASASNVGATLFSGTPDDKLTYSGNDPIVWENTNNERLRRGLAPLSNPKPADDGKKYPTSRGGTTGTGQTSKTFDVDAPPGMTREEAYAIFQKQVSSGGLTGFSPGDVLSAQTQAADGLAAAQSSITQSFSGIPGTDAGTLNSFKNIADTAKQSLAAGTTGSLQSSITNGASILSQSAAKISGLFGVPVTNGISSADFAKTAAAVVPMAGLSTTDVRATMAAVGTTTGQNFSQFTNSAGVGKFGFDATQLETAGLLKPGTASTFLSGGTNDLTSVLKSPAVWTGKGGINNLDSLLSNPAAQNLTQQNLMSSGISSAAALGVPVNSLSPKNLSGVSANFAKSSAGGVDWIKGNLPADKQADFDARFKDAQFAVSTAETKLNEPILQQAPPGEAENTVNRQTVDAATTRVVGNDKVPSFEYGNQPADAALVEENKALRRELKPLFLRVAEVNASEATPDQADAKTAQLDAIYKELKTVEAKVIALKARALNANPYSASFMKTLEEELADIFTAIDGINTLKKYLRQLKRQAEQQA